MNLKTYTNVISCRILHISVIFFSRQNEKLFQGLTLSKDMNGFTFENIIVTALWRNTYREKSRNREICMEAPGRVL